MRKKIYILASQKMETAQKLSSTLKDCTTGHHIPEDNMFVINYGYGEQNNAHLNKKIISDKYQQIKIFKANGLLCPDVLSKEQVMFQRPSYILRHKIAHLFPLIARKYKHTQGWDAIVLKDYWKLKSQWNRIFNKRDYFIKYIDKQSEFRVHVLGNDIGGVSQKIKYSTVNNDIDNEDDNHSYIPLEADKYIWSRQRGWIQVDYNGTLIPTLKELAIKACRALNYDFGAVDIIRGLDNRFYLLEVNSSPRLNQRRRVLYAKYFREEERKTR